jgi:putative membrane protein
MATMDTASPAGPAQPTRRDGFYISPWVLAVLGGLVLLGIGFVIGRVADHGDHHARPAFRGDDGDPPRGLGILIVLIVIALIITGIVLLVRHYTTPRRDLAMPTTATTAEQVLADRFARGEIDEAEFVSRRNVLRG